jgi:tetratricopeptide (TPR) repeat protein
MMKMKFNYAVFCFFSVLVFAGCDRTAFNAASSERAESLYRAAMAEYQAGRLDKAISYFEKALTANPLNASARFQLACLKQDSTKDYLGALIDYKEFLRLESDGDKAKVARTRLEMCRALVFQNSSSSELEIKAMEQSLQKLKDENASLKRNLNEAVQKYDKLLSEHNRTKKMIKSVGAASEEEVAPVKYDIPKEFLSEEENVRPVDVAAFAKEAKKDEAEENLAAPFSGSKVKSAHTQTKPASSVSSLPEKPKTYKVQEGETLTAIARKFYGHGRYWRKIQEANRLVISVDGKVRAGMEIQLP